MIQLFFSYVFLEAKTWKLLTLAAQKRKHAFKKNVKVLKKYTQRENLYIVNISAKQFRSRVNSAISLKRNHQRITTPARFDVFLVMYQTLEHFVINESCNETRT